MGNGDIITLTEGKSKIDGIGGTDTSTFTGATSSIFFNEDMDGVPPKADRISIRALGRTSQIERLKDKIKNQMASIDFDVIVDIPDEEDREPTDKELQAAESVEQFFNTQFNTDNETIDELHGKILEDVLDLNNGIVELKTDSEGYLNGMIARDGLTFTINQKDNGLLPGPESGEPAFFQFGLTNNARRLFSNNRQGIDLRNLHEHINELGFGRLFSNKETKKFSRDQIVRFSESQNAKTDSPYGRGRTEKVKDAAEIMINGDIHRNKFFLDNEFHKGVMNVGGNLSQDDKKALKNRFKGSAGNEHELPIIGGGENVDYISIDPEPEKMQFLESQKWYAKRVVWNYGLNDVEAGQLEDANKGIGDAGKRQLWENVTSGLIEMFENRWNNQVLPFMREYEAVDGNLKVVYRPDNKWVERIENDIIKEELDTDTITINEARQKKEREEFGELGELPKTVFEELARDNPTWVAEQLTGIEDIPEGSGGGGGGLFESFPVLDNGKDNDDGQKNTGGNNRERSGQTGSEDGEVSKQTFSDYPEAAQENARMALEAREETGNPNDCGTRVGWERANQLDNGEALSEDTIGRMASFARHEDNSDQGEEGRADCGWMMWKAWGGTEGIEWAQRKLDEIEEDSKLLNELESEGYLLFSKDKKKERGNGKSLNNINSYREAFKHTDELLERTKDALRNERGFKDVPGIVEHKNEMKEELGEAFGKLVKDIEGSVENEYPETDQDSSVLVDGDKIVEDVNVKDRISSILESKNLQALEMSAEHNEKDIENETEQRYTVPSETKVELSFDVLDTFTAELIRNEALSASTEIEGTVRDRVRSQLLKGAENGEGIDKIMGRVQDIADSLSRNHAELVARTETLSASRKGSQALAESTDLVGGKEWLATSDSRTREWHNAMDGTVISKDQQFTVPSTGSSDQPSDYPRTARVVGEDQPFNCRCSQAPVLSEDMPDSVTQLDAEFDSVTVDLGMSKRQFEVWKEHSREDEASFKQFWDRVLEEKSMTQTLKDFGMSKTTYYNWKG